GENTRKCSCNKSGAYCHDMCACTGYDAVSLQPNAGSQGEYAGLLAIKRYHESRGDNSRIVCLIPQSAHGTNPASAQMCGMQVVVVACDDQGNIDIDDLKVKIDKHRTQLGCIMITYPSTHGVFESQVKEVCRLVHEAGGQVYIDGANLNAMVGVARPGEFGGDVSHLNLHKTFCIPHGGGGPGVGPIGVGAHLAPFLPGHRETGDASGVVSAAPWGSALILTITWMYIRMMGAEGLRQATRHAILSANYIASALSQTYDVLYKGEHGYVAHECILDTRTMKDHGGVTVEDIAKRLIDFGFHAPTMSFPVAGTLMIEPTESEPLRELNRFCGAMNCIYREYEEVLAGRVPSDDNPLCNAPHTAAMVASDVWEHPYSREQAAFPASPASDQNKYWVPVGRVDNVHGDKHLICTCPPMESYQQPDTVVAE
ncbi:MAG: aminotransferase class V-fold PLP-dependent enzyme, partial [Pseudomonadota bacterium]